MEDGDESNDEELDFYNNKLLWSMVQHVSSRDVYMHHLYAKAISSHSRKVKIEMIREINQMLFVDETFSMFLDRPSH
jgi:hypothetical protein